MNAVKPLYQSSKLEEALQEYGNLKETYEKKYPKIFKLLKSNENLYSFYKYPIQIRRSIYATNLVEGLNKQLKRQTKKKEQLPNEDSLERFVCNYFLDYNARLRSRIHKSFGDVTMELNEMFNLRYKTK